MIGANIRKARAERSLSLRKLAQLIEARGVVDGLSYSAIQRIESGQRRVATFELAELAEVLNTSMAVLVGGRGRSAPLDLAARVANFPDEAVLGSVKRRAVEILEAQDLLGRLVAPLPPLKHVEIPSLPSTRTSGKRLAKLMRERLQLGSAPIADLASLIEESFAALVSTEPLPEGTSGFCAMDHDAGVILINGVESIGDQTFTLAHELCHLLLRDVDTVEILGPREGSTSGSEGRADEFAAHFLAPDEALRGAVSNGKADVRMVAQLAHRFSMSAETMASRLGTLGLLGSDFDLGATRRRLAEMSELVGEARSEERAEGRRKPSRTLTALALSALEDGHVGIGLVSMVTGERDLDRLRKALEGSFDVENSGIDGGRSV